jgi:hypothetical protein
VNSVSARPHLSNALNFAAPAPSLCNGRILGLVVVDVTFGTGNETGVGIRIPAEAEVDNTSRT